MPIQLPVKCYAIILTIIPVGKIWPMMLLLLPEVEIKLFYVDKVAHILYVYQSGKAIRSL